MDKLPPELLLQISDHLDFYDQNHLKYINKINYETIEIKQYMPSLLICRNPEIGITHDCYPEYFIDIYNFRKWYNNIVLYYPDDRYDNEYLIFVLVSNKPVRKEKKIDYDFYIRIKKDGTISTLFGRKTTISEIISECIKITNIKLTMDNCLTSTYYK